jgi:hypothetical protein
VEEECPVKERCDFKQCDGKKFWLASKRKIFPKFFLNLKVHKLPKVSEPLLFQLGTTTYDQLKEHIEFIYDSATVYLPVSFRDYMLREIELTPIGYLARTSLIYLRFNNTLMNLFIDKAISEDSQLLEILKFKYFMFKILQTNKYSSLDVAMQYKKYSSSKIDVNEKDFRVFVESCLVHSLAHLLFLFLVKRTQIDPEKITYFIGDGSTIYILENSKNDGMGLVETIKSAIENNGERKLIEEFVEYSQNFLLRHEEHIKRDQDLLKEEAQEFLGRIMSTIPNKDKIIALQKKIKELNSSISQHIDLNYIDLVTYRHILSKELSSWENFEDELSEYLLPLIYAEGFPKICTDGCEDCLLFYRGCTQSFIQNYTISKHLVLKFLEFIKSGNFSVIKSGLGEIMENLMEKSNKIIIKVPFIDDFGYSLLTKFKEKEISIITREDNPYISRLLNEGIKVKTMPKIHTKLYYFEDGENSLFIHGSINLTYTSFYKNEENLVIVWDPLEVKRIKGEIPEANENEDN